MRVQLPLALSETSEPEPDLALVAPGSYRREQPRTAFLIIEVADSSLREDRDRKLPLYAAAGIPEVWLVDAGREIVTVHTRPEAGAYTQVTRHEPGDSLSPGAFPDVAVKLAAIFHDE